MLVDELIFKKYYQIHSGRNRFSNGTISIIGDSEVNLIDKYFNKDFETYQKITKIFKHFCIPIIIGVSAADSVRKLSLYKIDKKFKTLEQFDEVRKELYSIIRDNLDSPKLACCDNVIDMMTTCHAI